MGDLTEGIKYQSDWIVRAFASDKLVLDHTFKSFIHIDVFFELHADNGKAVPGGRLVHQPGATLLSIGAYVGETVIRQIPGSAWDVTGIAPEEVVNASLKLPDGTVMWPMQKVMKRFANGSEDAVYPYGLYLAGKYLHEAADPTFREQLAAARQQRKSRKWWKFWQ